MSSYYQPAGSYQTVQVLGPAVVLDVEMVSFYTLPTGIYVEYPVPLLTFQSGGPSGANTALLDNVAQAVESHVASNGVVGGTYVEDVDPVTGLLTAYIQYDIAHTNATTGAGPFTTSVNIPMTDIVAGVGASTGIGGLQVPPSQNPNYVDPNTTLGNAYQALVTLAGG